MPPRRALQLSAVLYACSALVSTACAPEAAHDEVGDAAIACERLAGAYCARLEVCAPAIVFRSFGDHATCLARIALDCRTAPVKAAPTSACADAVPAIGCPEFLSGAHPAACAPLGRERPADRPMNDVRCKYSAQCPETCFSSMWGGCGFCMGPSRRCTKVRDTEAALALPIDVPGVSRGIQLSGCAPGLSCTNEGNCVQGVGEGNECSESAPCLRSLECEAGVCRKLAQKGEACGTGKVSCDPFRGLRCGPGLKCVDIPRAAEGQACAFDFGWVTLCGRMSTCSAGPEATEGTCVPTIPDGSACASSTACLWPARCIRSVCTAAAEACG